MPYNKSYNKDSGRYSNENRKPRFNIALAIWVLVLLGVLYAVIFHGSEIRSMIAGNSSGEKDRLVAPDNDFTSTEKKELKRDVLFEEEKNEAGSAKVDEKALAAAEVNKPEVKPLDKKPIEQAAAAENTPVSAKEESYSNHELERFIGQDNGKYGVKDLTTKKILIAPIYDKIKEIHQGLKNPYIVVCKDQLWGVVNVKNEIIIPIENTNINEYVYKRAEIYLQLTRKNADGSSLEGYARMPEGKMVVPFKYGYVSRLTNDYKYFEVKENVNEGNYGIVNQDNKLVLPIEYASISTTIKANGYAIISKFTPQPADGRTHYLSGVVRLSDGKIIVPVEYQELEIIGPASFIRVKKDGLYGCINDKNEVIVPFQKVTGIGAKIGSLDDSENNVRFTLPNGETVAYGVNGQRVPTD